MQATMYLLLGRLLGRMKQYKAALRYFQRAADLNPNSKTAHCWIGWAYSQLSDYATAVSSFERAIQIAPSCAYAHAQMACSFVQLNRHQEAVDELLRAFRMNPKYARHCGYLVALGSAYGHLGLFQESATAYQKASELLPNDADSVHGYGWALSALRRF